MADAIVRLRVESQEYDQKLSRATQQLQHMEKEVRRTGATFAYADKEELEFIKSLGSMETKADSAKGKIAEMTKSFTELSLQYRNLTAAEKSAPFGKALSASLTQLQGRIKTLRTDLNVVQTSLGSKIGGGFLQGMGSGMSMLGPVAAGAAAATAAITGMKKVMTDIVQINMQFEQGTANLASIMGQSREEIVQLTTQAKNLGATTRYTAMQITELQTNLARLGFTQQEILNSTTAVQALATATGADLGEAANLAGAALRGFGLNASEMERVASVLSVSTTKSALSFEKLATAVPIVAPVAKQFGFTIEDTVTLLAKLSDAGMDASSAATATRNIFLKMANDSGKLAQALGRPVHSVEEFGEALKEMRQKGMSLNDILSMVGVRSTAAFAVFADNAETLKDFKQSITDCSTAMHDMESKQLDTLQGSITILNSAWEGLMLTFSESNGTIKKLTDSLANLLGAWTKWRNRNAGGDAAIQTYELGVTKKDQVHSTQLVQRYRNAGWDDKDIAQKFTSQKSALETNRDAMRDILDEWEKAGKLGWGSDAVKKLVPEVEALFGKMEGAAYQWSGQMQRAVAKVNDQIAVKEYQISMVTPASVATHAGASDGSQGSGDTNTKLLKAQYEEQEKTQIAALDRMSMNEEDYEAKVYQIKRETLQKIADLYQEETAEKARANAAMADLDIRYQATMMRLANRAGKKDDGNYMSGPAQTPLEALQDSIRRQQADQAAAIDENSLKSLLGVAIQNGLNGLDLDFSQAMSKMWEGMDVSAADWKALEDKINEQLAALSLDPIKLDVETGNLVKADKEVKSTTTAWQAAASAVATVGSALQQIEDPTAKIAGLIAQAVAQIALTFATSLKGTVGPWDWIAAATTGLATMISTITAIKSVTSAGNFAVGGIVPGSSFSGDNITANVNSGELILNRAQQGSIAGQLNSNPMSNMQLETRISGTDMLIFLNNTNRSLGGSRSFYSERH